MSKHSGLHIYQDSGPPQGSTDYTTLILLHGYAWHSGIFSKMVPLSETYNVRVVLVNRRDYPGATPHPKEERALLDAAAAEVESDPAAARAKILSYMEYNARDLYDFLIDFIASNDVPKASVEKNSGGIVVGGWSFASGWMLALLAYAHSFPVGEVDVGKYIRRVILYDAPYHVLGYPPLDGDIYGNPLFDPSLAEDEKTRMFADWVSGYYKHPLDSLDALERRTPLTHPPPTISAMTAEERALALYPSPGDPGGSDCVLNLTGIPSGAWPVLRESALRVPQGEGGDAATGSRSWDAVELVYLWCDATVWEVIWGVHSLKQAVQEARIAGDKVRRVTFVQIKDANHFIHWDRPEDTVRACLAATSELEEVVIGSA
ncbi:alpha/beta-hydrolase [Lentinus tigrinus ALCF2SS1-7]|uniref:Alpha/beta-hydrolase n=1 Tax=Lentinus tigrinus ALCF2SS1-6 TaxID=1328759 RepID=A0A5C2S3I1_9APHY|nr:alpha/beta-hydrolase [Lentinus tigrinus ALCF2SS1-6]RPD73015.1 alpha/beta-hydrolase [Lentinus tigrinus ALCF2SS1-7]